MKEVKQSSRGRKLVTPKEMAKFFGVREKTLEELRVSDGGAGTVCPFIPPFIRISRRCVRYDLKAVKVYYAERRIKTLISNCMKLYQRARWLEDQGVICGMFKSKKEKKND